MSYPYRIFLKHCSEVEILFLRIFLLFFSGEANIAYTDVPQNEILEVTADTKTVMNVTMNPLEKLEGFQEANKEESKVVAKNKNDKMNLEWDDAYIA